MDLIKKERNVNVRDKYKKMKRRRKKLKRKNFKKVIEDNRKREKTE